MSRAIKWSVFISLLFSAFAALAQDTSTSLIWYYTAPNAVNVVAATDDVDGNGSPDVLAGSADNTVYCLQGFGANAGLVLWSYKTSGPVLSLCTIGDLDGDGIADCLVGSADDSVYCLSASATAQPRLLWKQNLSSDVTVVKSIDDVDGDAKQDCLAGTTLGKIICLTGSGTTLWQGSASRAITAIETGPLIDADDKPDVFVASLDKFIYFLSGVGNGEGGRQLIMARYLNVEVTSVTSVPDVDGDGKDDCVLGAANGLIGWYSPVTSNELHSFYAQGRIHAVKRIDDINEDGFPDIIACSADNNVYARDGNDASVIWSATFSDDVLTAVGLPDMNQDGKMDVVVTCADNRIVCLSGGGAKAGKELWSVICSDDAVSLDVLPDVRNNGVSEVIAGGKDALVRLLEGNATILDVELSVFQANVRSDGVLLSWQTAAETRNLGFDVEFSVDGRIFERLTFIAGHGTTNLAHAYEYLHQGATAGKTYYRLKQIDNDGRVNYSPVLTVSLQTPERFLLTANYPNPFNNGTFLQYVLPDEGEVTFTLYNIRGEEIYQRRAGRQAAGSYILHWNGETTDGRQAGTGAYLYVVQWRDQRLSGKWTLVK